MAAAAVLKNRKIAIYKTRMTIGLSHSSVDYTLLVHSVSTQSDALLGESLKRCSFNSCLNSAVCASLISGLIQHRQQFPSAAYYKVAINQCL